MSPKRRKEGEEGGLADQNTPMKRRGAEEMMMATTPKPAPMRKTAMLKMAEKTSLTPHPMEMCSPSPTRRSTRGLTFLISLHILLSGQGERRPSWPRRQQTPSCYLHLVYQLLPHPLSNLLLSPSKDFSSVLTIALKTGRRIQAAC